MNISMTLNYLRPGEEWTLDGDTYEGLTWLSDTPKPTEAEITAAWPDAQQAAIDEAEAKAAQRDAALAKLAALGLTVDDLTALGL